MTERIRALNSRFIENGGEKSAFLALVWGLGAMFALYSYLVGSIIFTAVEHRHLDASARELRARIGVLEVEHLALSGKVDLELAHRLGFKEAVGQVFAERKAAQALSLSANEI